MGRVAGLLASIEHRIEPGGLDELDEAGLLEVMAAFARIEAFAAAGARAAAGALASRVELQDRRLAVAGGLELAGLVADEVSARLGVSRAKATRMVGEGRAFAGVLCAVGDALIDGDIDAGKASVFVERLADQPDTVALAVCELVLPGAPMLTHHALGREIDRALVSVDPEGGEARHLAAVARRRVAIRRTGDGMAVLTLHASLTDVALVDSCLERIARAARRQGDARSLDQLRADVLVSMAEGVAAVSVLAVRPDPQASAGEDKQAFAVSPSAVSPPGSRRVSFGAGPLLTLRLPRPGETAAGSRPSLAQVYEAEFCAGASAAGAAPAASGPIGEDLACTCADLDLDALTGVAARDLVSPPAEVIGMGPISPGVARRLAERAPSWLRLIRLRECSGEAPASAPGYRPTAELDRWVRQRDEHCVAPGCSVPSSRCDLDHVVPYPGGRTSAENLVPVCRHHHLIKTHGGHGLRRDVGQEGVTLVWTTRLGQRFRRDPATNTWSRETLTKAGESAKAGEQAVRRPP